MKNTEILSRINALLNRKVKLEQATLDNGTVVEADSFTIGSPIFAINGENKDPLELGSYTLADGTVIEVYEIGFIGEIATASAESGEAETEVEAGKKKETAMADVPATLEEILTAVVDAMQPKLDELQAKIDALTGGQTEMKAKLSSTPATRPTKHKPTELTKEIKTKSFDPQSLIFAKLANINR
jgi:hypothetical protein